MLRKEWKDAKVAKLQNEISYKLQNETLLEISFKVYFLF